MKEKAIDRFFLTLFLVTLAALYVSIVINL